MWWLLAALVAGAIGLGTFLFVRSRRRRLWREELETIEGEVAWFVHDLLAQLRRSRSMEEAAGGWQVGRPRVAAAEDRLTALESSAPGEEDRTRARTLRDAVRIARERLDGMARSSAESTENATWALDLDDVSAGLEAALGPPPESD